MAFLFFRGEVNGLCDGKGVTDTLIRRNLKGYLRRSRAVCVGIVLVSNAVNACAILVIRKSRVIKASNPAINGKNPAV